MTIFESSMSSKHFGRQLELPLLRELGRVLAVALGVFAVLRFEDLYHRGVLPLLFHPSYEQSLFLLELALSIVIPLVLLSQYKVRQSAGGLYLVAVLVVLGFVTNRLNVSITGMETSAGLHYVPKWTEVAVTASIIAVGFALFAAAAKYLPIFPAEPAVEEAAVVEALPTEVVLGHAGD
jgi:Ni/Fe-hydrogenase subunit HybB-like protein